MRNFLFLVLLAALNSASASIVQWDFERVVDGDTISFVNHDMPKELQKVSIRIAGIDTPESNYMAKCDKEKQLGVKAKLFLYEYVKNKNIKADVKGWDKYGGRVLGDVYANDISLKDVMIINGYARPYNGGPKSNWCD